MNGKLIVKLVEAALREKPDQVKMIANLLSSELRKNYPELSKEITALTKANGLRGMGAKMNSSSITPNPIMTNELVRENPLEKLNKQPVWSVETQSIVEQLLKEHSYRDKLLKGGLEPIKTLIFTGPPGVGKTISAQWIAQNMGIPLLVLDLATVMSSYLGKTGNNLKSVIDYAAANPCVLLLDEFDAIAKKRDDDSDVGELKRLVTVLLQTIDTWPSSSLLIAATNHPELLDPAVWRRFEEKVIFDHPHDEQIKEYLEELTNNKKVKSLYPFYRGMSYSDIRTDILKNKKISLINEVDLFEQLTSSCASDRVIDSMAAQDKKELAVALFQSKLSQRKIAEMLNVSRQTVKKALTDAEAQLINSNK